MEAYIFWLRAKAAISDAKSRERMGRVVRATAPFPQLPMILNIQHGVYGSRAPPENACIAG